MLCATTKAVVQAAWKLNTTGNTVYIKHFTGKVQPATHTTFKRSGLYAA